MAFHVTVKGGPDDGQSFRVDGQAIVGRGPRCQIQLTDQSVAWEHAALQDQNGRLFLQNLSAAGVKHHGRSVSGETRLTNGDEVAICATTSLVVEERIGGDKASGVSPVILAVLVLVLLLGGVGAFVALRPKSVPVPNVTVDHWKTAYTRIDERLGQWEIEGRFPAEGRTLLQDAWRLEMAFNDPHALQRYEALSSALLTLAMPSRTSDADTIAEGASLKSDALKALMDWPERVYEFDAELRTDEALADGLVWFARERAKQLKTKLQRQ